MMKVAAWMVAISLLLVSVSAADSKNNPADELVSAINSNRTAHKSTSLIDNVGLGCLALQYIKAYQGQCGGGNGPGSKKPAESDFIDTFAPNCGVLPNTLAPITGRLVACQTKYVPPAEAFSSVLIENEKSLQILYDKNHTQVGAAVSGTDGGSPYFWCVLFSSGKPNNTFSLEGGVAKVVRPGCFSGDNDDCSGALRSWGGFFPVVMAAIVTLLYV